MPSLEDIGYDYDLHEAMLESIRQRKLTLSGIIESLTIAYVNLYRLNHASKINCGMCEDFATDVQCLFPNCSVLWDDQISNDSREGSHCVIIYGNRYFDCECADGVVILDDLPYFKRIEEQIKIFDRDDNTFQEKLDELPLRHQQTTDLHPGRTLHYPDQTGRIG